MFVINIEKSPLRNRIFRVYLINGDHVDIGNVKTLYYVDHGNIDKREIYFNSLTSSQIKSIKSLKPSQLLYEFFLLNGYSKNIINNINFLNREFFPLK